jgi:hypothetical protein
MKKALVVFIVLVFACSGCIISGFKRSIKGSGTLQTEERNVPQFEGISVAGSFDVKVRCGEKQKVVVSCDDNLLPYIITEVDNGTLEIYTDDPIKPKAGNEIIISAGSIKSFSIAGSSDSILKEISTESFTLDIAGSGDIILTGKTSDFMVDIAGSGDVNAKDLIAENVSIDIAGSGDAIVSASKKLSVDIAGSGDVTYYGNPHEVTTDVAGSGDISKM